MNDKISRLISNELNLRIYTVNSLNTARELIGIHNTTPNATMAFGRTINCAALLTGSLKPESNQSLSVKFSGSGPIKEVHVQADARGNIRGYVANPGVDLTDDIGTLSFSKTIGAGLLTVSKDIGLNEPYSSVTPLLYGEAADDFAYYLTTSEQVPSAVILGLNLDDKGFVVSSGGILIQTFPDTKDSVIEKIESSIKSMDKSLGDMLFSNEDMSDIVKSILNVDDIEIVQEINLEHSCPCSKNQLGEIMNGFARTEVEEMLHEDKGAEITCTFCKTQYHFDEGDLGKILEAIDRKTIQ